jgi:hypothetical protein
MSTPMPAAPCTWPIDRCMLPPLPDPLEPDYSEALGWQLAAEDVAVRILWALSGRQFGICQTMVRPCADEHQPLRGRWGPVGVGYIAWMVLDDWGDMDDADSWICHGRCLISSPQAVHLPGPVYQDATGNYPIVVQIHDYVLDPNDYTVEGDVLHRRWEHWPRQNFARPLGEHNTWSVTYWRGTPPPAGAARFAGIMTKEIMLAGSGGKCRLPATVTSMSRAGVSYGVFNPQQIYDTGKTGIPEIDVWLASINPHHLLQAPSVI